MSSFSDNVVQQMRDWSMIHRLAYRMREKINRDVRFWSREGSRGCLGGLVMVMKEREGAGWRGKEIGELYKQDYNTISD